MTRWSVTYVVWPALRENLELAPLNAAQVGAWHDARWKGGGAYFLLTASIVAIAMLMSFAPSSQALTGTPLGLSLTFLPPLLLFFLSIAGGVLLRVLNDAHVKAEYDHA